MFAHRPPAAPGRSHVAPARAPSSRCAMVARRRCSPDNPPGGRPGAGRRLMVALVGLVALVPACQPSAAPGPGLPASGPTAGDDLVIGGEAVFPRPAARDQSDIVPVPSTTVFHVTLVRVPRDKRALFDKAWNYLRTDVLDSATTLRLQQNGLRVGVGHEQWWEPIRAIIESIDGQLTAQPAPWRLPPRFPLYLELTEAPREHTLFCIGFDGVLSGDTWPNSRCALQLSYVRDPVRPDHVRTTLVPVVRRLQPGRRLMPTETGTWQVPRYDGRVFDAAGMAVSLGPGEFVLVAPHESADVAGMIGDTLLSQVSDGQRYDQYVFVKPEVADNDADE
jgi:hypothetical protein